MTFEKQARSPKGASLWNYAGQECSLVLSRVIPESSPFPPDSLEDVVQWCGAVSGQGSMRTATVGSATSSSHTVPT